MIHTKRREAGCGRSLRDPHIKGGCCHNPLSFLHSSLHFPLPVLLLSRCLSLSLPTLRPLALHSSLFALLLPYSLTPPLSLARSLSLMHTCRVPRRWWQHFAKKLEIMLLNQGRCDQDRRQTLLDQDCRVEECRQDRHAIVIMLNTYLHIYIHDP